MEKEKDVGIWRKNGLIEDDVSRNDYIVDFNIIELISINYDKVTKEYTLLNPEIKFAPIMLESWSNTINQRLCDDCKREEMKKDSMRICCCDEVLEFCWLGML